MKLKVEIVVDAGSNRRSRELALKANGYKIVRHFCRLRRSLTEPIDGVRFPLGYTFRTLSSVDEIPRRVEAYNNAFVDHWHFHEMTPAQALQFATQDPNYRLDGDFVALGPDGAIAGFCQCVIRSNENLVCGRREGWISLLGVCQKHRRLGLGSCALEVGTALAAERTHDNRPAWRRRSKSNGSNLRSTRRQASKSCSGDVLGHGRRLISATNSTG